jgi:hypothetical protein
LLALKTLVKKNWRNLQFLSANLYHTGTEGMGWHSDAENLKRSYRLCKVLLPNEDLPSNTDSKETVSELIPRLVGDEDETKLTGSTLTSTTRITTPR